MPVTSRSHPPSLPSQPRGSVKSPRKVKVLYIIDELDRLGGAERVLLNIVSRLPKERFECAIATFRSDPELRQASIPCPFYVLPLRRTYDWNACQTAWRLAKLIRSRQVDIVHTFFETSDLWAGPIAWLSGCKVLISSRRDLGILRSSKHRLAYRLTSWVYDQIQTVSREVAAYCVAQDRVAAQKIKVIRNGVNLDAIAAQPAADIRARMQAVGATRVVGTLANVRPVKGLDVLIRAAARVHGQFPDALFVIAGDVPDPAYRKELQEMISAAGMEDRCVFLGRRRDVFEVLHALDVFCLLSRSEGLSNALLEAMAVGLPCIATRVGGNPELIDDGCTGLLVPPGDDEAAASAILSLLLDPDRANRIGGTASKTIHEEFGVDRMMAALVDSYDGLLHAQPPMKRATL